METRTKQQWVLLAVLVGLLVGVLYWNLSGEPTPLASTKTPGAARARPNGAPSDAPPDVALQALQAARPEPAEGDRNPFRFKPTPAPVPVPETGHARGPEGGADTPPSEMPAGPPPPPSIPLKFIGLVEEPERHRRIAALSDGRFTYYGREGDIIEGRYRIVKIGVESIEMVHVDGRGPQTIRLSGS
jgi:hypothetical protein